MPLPSPWMPLLIERTWFTPRHIGVFSAAFPAAGVFCLLLALLYKGGRSLDTMLGLGALLWIPLLILCYFFLGAMKKSSPWRAVWHLVSRGTLAGGAYGALLGALSGSADLFFIGAIVGVVWGFCYTLAYLPILGWVVHLEGTPAHDTPSRLLLAVSLWLGVILSLVSLLVAEGINHRLPAWPGQALGIVLVLIAMGRDLRLWRVLSRLYAGKVAGMRLLPANDEPEALLSGLLPLVSGAGANYDALLFCVESQEDGPFRSAESKTPLALCPMARREGMLLVKRRLGVALLGLALLGLLLWLPLQNF